MTVTQQWQQRKYDKNDDNNNKVNKDYDKNKDNNNETTTRIKTTETMTKSTITAITATLATAAEQQLREWK
jgi:hypothetical protein